MSKGGAEKWAPSLLPRGGCTVRHHLFLVTRVTQATDSRTSKRGVRRDSLQFEQLFLS